MLSVENSLQIVYENGELLIDDNLDEIRKRANSKQRH